MNPLSLLSMMYPGGLNGSVGGYSTFSQGQGQGQQGQGYGWSASPWMQMFSGFGGNRSDQTDQGNSRDTGNVMDPCGSKSQQQRTMFNDPRTAMGLGALGLNMLQPRPYGSGQRYF